MRSYLKTNCFSDIFSTFSIVKIRFYSQPLQNSLFLSLSLLTASMKHTSSKHSFFLLRFDWQKKNVVDFCYQWVWVFIFPKLIFSFAFIFLEIFVHWNTRNLCNLDSNNIIMEEEHLIYVEYWRTISPHLFLLLKLGTS